MEGHTPRGFQGSGAGLFAGDNLNRNFPNGDGVQIFLTFDLSGIPAGKVESAVLRAANATVIRTPFEDLGVLRAEEIRFDDFSSALWDAVPVAEGAVCTLAVSAGEPTDATSQGPFRVPWMTPTGTHSSGSDWTKPETGTASKTWWRSSRPIPTPMSLGSFCWT
jgi:hypothetical protein